MEAIRKFFKKMFFPDFPEGSRGSDSHDGSQKSNYRDYHLVVATLIAAVTFQAGVNPPGGVWQDTNHEHHAGTAIYATDETAFLIFLICNTLALSSSILIILCLTWGFPFFPEVIIATFSMVMTYGSSVFAVTPRKEHRVELKFRYVLFIAAVPVVVRVVIQIYDYVIRKRPGELKKDEKKSPFDG